MLDKARKLTRALGLWSSQTLQTVNRVDLQLAEAMSPVDRHLFYNGVHSRLGLSHPSYADWRAKRINKMLEIYGLDRFKGMRILELGAGHGDIGAFFAEIGADVLCLDGRAQNVALGRLKQRKIAGIRFEQRNLEGDFAGLGRFDLVIHFGLLYHIRDVEAHLRRCFALADDIVLETVVLDSTDPHRIVHCDERSWVNEDALDGVGSRPSPYFVERVAAEAGFEATRHFTPDLNSGGFVYDWQHRNDGSGARGGDTALRRFWLFQRTGAAAWPAPPPGPSATPAFRSAKRDPQRAGHIARAKAGAVENWATIKVFKGLV